MEQLGLWVHAYHRILKLARSIATLAGSKEVGNSHMAEATDYRVLDRQ